MSAKLEVPVINPAFYDALSGEFTADCDEQGRQHTVGRLVLATFLKGKRIPSHSSNEFWVEYSPSWAPKSKTIITGKNLSDNNASRSHVRFISVGMGESDEHEERFSIWDCSIAAEPSQRISVRAPGEEQLKRIAVDTPETLDSARAFIAECATRVFKN